ncbi:uncharacterized protein LOC133179761 [Saccostrea echinata]|uniref:uncharacterized protein LOC133179761 n=1 Tax=Saccostrea echinata TaxID=191078 RepID=UPI002A7EF502|nr:uncharacterized protein LOC133179761 [Saccostrea echinata]
MDVSDNQLIYWRFFVLSVISWFVLPVYGQGFHGAGTPSNMYVSPSRYGARNPSAPSGQIIQNSALPAQNSVKYSAKRNAAKPGLCPSVVLMTSKKCPDACGDDNDCAGMKKCCLNGCGKKCTAPEIPAINLVSSAPTEQITNKPEMVPEALSSQINGSHANINNSQSTEAPPSGGLHNQQNQPPNQNINPVGGPSSNSRNMSRADLNNRPIPFSFLRGSTGESNQNSPRGGSNSAPNQNYYSMGGTNNPPSNPVNREILQRNFRGGPRNQPPPEFANPSRHFNNYSPGSNGQPYDSNTNGGFHNQQGFQHNIPAGGSSTISPRVMGGQNHNTNMYSGQPQNNNPIGDPHVQQGYHGNYPLGGSNIPMGGYNPANVNNNQQSYSPIPQYDSYDNPSQGQPLYGRSNQYSNPVGGSYVQSGPPSNQYTDPLGGSNVQSGPPNNEFSNPVGGSNIQSGLQNNQNVNPLGGSHVQPNPPNNHYSHPVGGSNTQSGPPNNQYSDPTGGSNTHPGPGQHSSPVGASNPSNNQHSFPMGGAYNAPHNSSGGYPGYDASVAGTSNQQSDPRSGFNGATYDQPIQQASELIQNSQQNRGSNYQPASGSNHYNQQNGRFNSQQGHPRVHNQYTPDTGGLNHQLNNPEIQPNIPYNSPSQSQNTYEVQSTLQQQRKGGTNTRYDNPPSRQYRLNNPDGGSNTNGGGSNNLYNVPLYQTTPLYDVRDGLCPQLRSRGVCQDECHADSECLVGRKCCFNGCGRVCMIPVFEGSQSIHTVPEAIQTPLKQEHQVRGDPISHIDPHSLNLIEIRPYSVGQSHSAVQILPYDHSGGHYDVGHENTIYNELVHEPSQNNDAYSYTTEPPYVKSETKSSGVENIMHGIPSDKANLLPGSAVKFKPSVFGSYKILPFNMEKIRKRNSVIDNQSGAIPRRVQTSGPEVQNSRPFDVRKPETQPRTSQVKPAVQGLGGTGSEPWNMDPKVQGGQGTFKQTRPNVQSPEVRIERPGNYNLKPKNPGKQTRPQEKGKQYPEVKIPQRTPLDLPNRRVPEVINEQQKTTAGVIQRVKQIRPSVDGSNVVRKANLNTFKIRESQNHNGALKITPLETEGFASQSLQTSKIRTVQKPKMQNFQRSPPEEVGREGPKVKYTTTKETMSTGLPESTFAGPQQQSPRLTPAVNRNSNLRLTVTSAPVRDPDVNQKGEINPPSPNKKTASQTDPVKKSEQQGPDRNVNPVNSIDYKHNGYGKNVYDPMAGRSAPQELNPSNQFETGMIRPMPKSGSSFSLTGGGKDPGSNMYSGTAPLQYNAANLGIIDYGHPKASAFESQPVRREWLGQSSLGQSSSKSMLSISKIYHDIGHSRAIMEPPKPYEFSSEFRLRATERPIPTYRPPVNSLGQVYIDIAGFSDNSLKAPPHPMKLSSGVPGHIPEIKSTTPPIVQSTLKETPISYIERNTTDKVISNSLLKNPKPEKKEKPINPEKYIPAGMVLARGTNESISDSEPKPSPSAPRLGISSTLIGSAPVAPSSNVDSKVYNREGFNLFTGYKPQYMVPVKEIRNPSFKGTPVFSARSRKTKAT